MKAMVPAGLHTWLKHEAARCGSHIAQVYMIPGRGISFGKIHDGRIEIAHARSIEIAETNGERIFKAGTMTESVGLVLLTLRRLTYSVTNAAKGRILRLCCFN